MRHFDQLGPDLIADLFHRPPQAFDRRSPPAVLAQALGATLYVPGSRPDLAAVIRRRAGEGVRSMVIDLEDAVHDSELAAAVDNTVAAIGELAESETDVLLFVRPRGVDDLPPLFERLDESTGALTGIVAPKFAVRNAAGFLDAVRTAGRRSGTPLYAMPVLETPELLFAETRESELNGLAGVLADGRDVILSLRLGATDLCGLYGIRRDRDLTIYHVQLVADLIGDVVNRFGRLDGTGFTISGPVWEYFPARERILRPQLRASPFRTLSADDVREQLLLRDLDGLISEIVLDRANGLTGKTVIHPSHVPVVHAMSAVSHEEFVDAAAVLAEGTEGTDDSVVTSRGGVSTSQYRNKMNESRPHLRWARQIAVRASVFGVLNEQVSVPTVLAAMADQ